MIERDSIKRSSKESYEMWRGEGCFYYLWRIANGYLPYLRFGDLLCLDNETHHLKKDFFIVWKLWKP